MRPRLIGVGLPRSGTSFLASAVQPPRVGVHEFDAQRQALVVAAILNGTASVEATRGYLADRLRRSSRLDADVSHLNAFLTPEWVELDPDARFVMSVRDPIAWVDSFARHTNRLQSLAWHWRLLREARFPADRWPHTEDDEQLARRDLPSLDALLDYWAQHVSTVLSAVPPERLLVVRTEHLSDSLASIAEFIGWPEAAFDPADAQRNATAQGLRPAGVCGTLPKQHLRESMVRHLSTIDMQALGMVPLTEQLP